MKYITDYSDEMVEKAETLFEKMSAHPFNQERAKSFCETVRYMERIAQLYKGNLEIDVWEENFLGRILLKCDGYHMFSGEDDIPRVALAFALKHMTSIFFDSQNGKLVIDMVENLA